jgi:hypothetical protein
MEKEMGVVFTLTSAGMKSKNKKKFRYVRHVPTYTGSFRTLV